MLDLGSAIEPGEDQVLFIDIGPTDGAGADRVSSLGRPHQPRAPGPVIV